mgnify:CR=1 FL=1
MNNSTLLVELQNFIQETKWAYARTMPKWPHAYIIRDRVDEELFLQLVEHIRAHGYQGKFYKMNITYYDFEGMTYWTMGSPIDETVIINRCRKEYTYEVRLKEGRLPGD